MEEVLADYLRLEGVGPAFTQAFFMILATEVGDRTFFIAAIMAMRHPRLVIYSSAIVALIVMTFISCVFGVTAIAFIPRIYVHWAVIVLMLFFGLQLIRNGAKMSSDGFEELDGAETSAEKSTENSIENSDSPPPLPDSPTPEKQPQQISDCNYDVEKAQKRRLGANLSGIALEAFTLTFLAEWGDRSQLATIALAAASAPVGVLMGGIVGHSVCTGLAVIGGRLIANYISEKTITLSGGALFLGFGLYSLLMGP